MASILATGGIILVVWLILNFSILVHELGHAFTAQGMGVEVDSVTLGFIRLFSVRLFGIRINFGLIPFFGTTKFRKLMAECHWLTIFAVTLAGPVATFALAMAAFYLLGGLPHLAEIQRHGFFFSEILRSFLPHSPSVGPMLDVLEGSSQHGIVNFILFLTGLVNLLMTFANIVPIPAMDGGVMLFALMEGLIGKKVWSAYAILAPISLLAIAFYVIITPFIR